MLFCDFYYIYMNKTNVLRKINNSFNLIYISLEIV